MKTSALSTATAFLAVGLLGASLVSAAVWLVSRPTEPSSQKGRFDDVLEDVSRAEFQTKLLEAPPLEPTEQAPLRESRSDQERTTLTHQPTRRSGLGGDNRLEGVIKDKISNEPVVLFKVFCIPSEKGDVREYARLHPNHGLSRRQMQGRFIAPSLPPGTYNLLVRASSYEDFVMENITIPYSGVVSVEMSRGAHIEGRVLDVSGQAVSGVQVFLNDKKIFNNQPRPRVAIKQTDDSGRFLFPVIPPGIYTLSVISREANETEELVLQKDQRIEKDIYLPLRNTLRFAVTDTFGQALNHASVRLYSRGSYRTQVTDLTGLATLKYMASGEYVLKVSCRGFEPYRERITVQDFGIQDFRIQLTRSQKQEPPGGQ